MSLASKGYRQVEEIVETWTKKYQYHISLIESKPHEVKFMVEFSLPQPQKPVPVATIRVYFNCTDHDQLKITFRFEKDSLIHSPNKTIRKQQIEKWIDDSLAKKLLVRQTVFYLGTAYESTRVRDERQDNILRQIPKPEEHEFVYIHPDLLSDQRRLIEIMERPKPNKEAVEVQLKKYFREVDKENIGVITQPEFIALIKNVGIKLNPVEQKELIRRVDPQESGMVEWQNYRLVIGQFFEGLLAKKEAEVKLEVNYDEQVFSSILALVNDESQDIEEMMIQKFRAKDQDETGLTNINQVKMILDEINKKIRDDNQMINKRLKDEKEQKNKKLKFELKQEPLTVVQLADITKIITDVYGYQNIPYAKIHKHIIDYKVRQLASGRINSRVNNLQVHLQEIFSRFDDKKNGKIKVQNFELALNQSQKIKLTRAHIYLLKSLIPIDAKNEISYTDNSKFLAQLIKRFYLASSKKKE